MYAAADGLRGSMKKPSELKSSIVGASSSAAGAEIGFMTLVTTLRTGRTGTVVSSTTFEATLRVVQSFCGFPGKPGVPSKPACWVENPGVPS
jgi:hypothetical protein